MRQRFLHLALVLALLVQPVAAAGVWAEMLVDSANGAGHGVVSTETPVTGCHEAAPDLADCCDGMDGSRCAMDCGTTSPALSQPVLPATFSGHGVYRPAVTYAAPQSPPERLFKPPRTP